MQRVDGVQKDDEHVARVSHGLGDYDVLVINELTLKAIRLSACEAVKLQVAAGRVAEVGKRAAATYLSARTTGRWARGVIGLLRRLG